MVLMVLLVFLVLLVLLVLPRTTSGRVLQEMQRERFFSSWHHSRVKPVLLVLLVLPVLLVLLELRLVQVLHAPSRVTLKLERLRGRTSMRRPLKRGLWFASLTNTR
jgi:hypothetical protein